MSQDPKQEPSVPQPPQVPQDLQEKVAGIRALAQVHNLLGKGTYTVNAHEAVKQSLAFIESLHQQLVDEALQHPQVDTVPELSNLKKADK